MLPPAPPSRQKSGIQALEDGVETRFRFVRSDVPLKAIGSQLCLAHGVDAPISNVCQPCAENNMNEKGIVKCIVTLEGYLWSTVYTALSTVVLYSSKFLQWL